MICASSAEIRHAEVVMPHAKLKWHTQNRNATVSLWTAWVMNVVIRTAISKKILTIPQRSHTTKYVSHTPLLVQLIKKQFNETVKRGTTAEYDRRQETMVRSGKAQIFDIALIDWSTSTRDSDTFNHVYLQADSVLQVTLTHEAWTPSGRFRMKTRFRIPQMPL